MRNTMRKNNLLNRNPELAFRVSERISELYHSGITTNTGVARIIKDEFPLAFDDVESARSHVRKKVSYLKADNPAPVSSKPENDEPLSSDFLLAQKRKTDVSHYYIVTWGQNNTPVFTPFWDNILLYAKTIGASIHVIAGRYHNPTSLLYDNSEEKWADILLPYLDASVHDIHDRVRIVSNIKTQPTNNTPLSGMESVAQGKTCVFGHPRCHMKTVASLYGNGINDDSVYSLNPQFLFTTGAVTIPNYTDSRTGAKGHFHHTYGFVIIELLDDGTYRIRQVKACKDGSFTDLYWNFSKDGVKRVVSVKGIVFGDVHSAKLSPLALDRMLSMVDLFSPEYVVLHDIFDGESINPHEKDNPFKEYFRKKQGRNLLSHEIAHTTDIVNVFSQITKVVVVNSNHDYFLEKYIINSDWKKDVDNAPEYMKYSLAIIEGKTPKGLLPYLIELRATNKDRVICLGVDESFIIGNRECGQHGHLGVSGSKGSPSQLRKLSSKNTTGHTHSPLRIDGLTVVGCQDIFHGYNKGASNWWLCDDLIHEDNKDQQILHLGKTLTSIEI